MACAVWYRMSAEMRYAVFCLEEIPVSARVPEQCVRAKRQDFRLEMPFLEESLIRWELPLTEKERSQRPGYRPIEEEAPGIVERKSVGVPLETGILSIDSMFPRSAVDSVSEHRPTVRPVKTSIAMDAILNQKGKGVICIYVAIGQKASTIAKLVNTLKKQEADSYTIVVAATASDPAPLQYIAPYSGTALANISCIRVRMC